VQHRDGTVEMRMPDGVGNLFRTEDRSDRSYGPSGELLSSRTDRGVTRYEYDADGNLVCKLEPSGATWRYRWNAAGMLHRVVRPDGSVVDFGYDALGRRLYKRHAGKVTRWVWHRNVPLHEWTEDVQAADEGDDALPGESPDPEILRRQAELNDRLPQGPPIAGTKDAPVTWLFNPDGFAPLGAQVGDRSYAFVTDPLGAPVAVYDEHGALLWSGDVDSWGRLRDVDDRALWQPFRFPGQYEDVETGLYYNRFRYYDPEAGQYISEDPISLAGGLNPHAYVDDPLRYCDPFGLYNGEGERELGVYDTFHDHDLDEADWQSSRPQHFKKCNESLYNAMEKDSALKAAIEEKYPGTYEHVKPGPKGGFADSSPPGLTWHHADAPGKMELVDRVDHRKYHKIYHPDGSGGYKKWGKSCH
jgi:RHS repeat-associated protein